MPYLAALNPSAFTIEAWAYPTGGQGTFRSIVTSRDYAPGAAKGYVLYAASDNTGGCGRARAANVVYGPSIVLNQWTHLVGTYDGTTLRLYVNGALVSSNTVTYTPNTTRPLRVAAGRTESSAQYLLPGRVDEVAVYGSALSAARVQAHYDSGT